MPEVLDRLKPRYIVDEKGKKTAVVLDLAEYENLAELIEELEDARDLLKAELEATDFTPYEEFRKNVAEPRYRIAISKKAEFALRLQLYAFGR